MYLNLNAIDPFCLFLCQRNIFLMIVSFSFFQKCFLVNRTRFHFQMCFEMLLACFLENIWNMCNRHHTFNCVWLFLNIRFCRPRYSMPSQDCLLWLSLPLTFVVCHLFSFNCLPSQSPYHQHTHFICLFASVFQL